MRIFIGAVLLLGLAGCSSGLVVDDVKVPVLLSQSSHGDAFDQALISGELQEVRGCYGIGENVAVFPVGTTRTERGISLRDLGDVDLGETVEGGGGFSTVTQGDLAQYEVCGLEVGDEIIHLNPMDTN